MAIRFVKNEKHRQFIEWEWEYAKPLFQKSSALGSTNLRNKPYIPEESTLLIVLADRWAVSPSFIQSNVESGVIPVTVGWDVERNHSNSDGGEIINLSLYVKNEVIKDIEFMYPQLKIEAEEWEELLQRYKEASRLCTKAKCAVRLGKRRTIYSVYHGLRFECDLDKRREKDEEISRLKALSQNETPPSRSRWHCSMEAGCAAVAHAITSGQKWHRETKTGTSGFLDLMKSLYTGEDSPLSEAEDIAWKSLPQGCKAGSGNPDKKKNIQTLETPNIPQ